jgi:hypothetical protein
MAKVRKGLRAPDEQTRGRTECNKEDDGAADRIGIYTMDKLKTRKP